jgi:hypothetical protein
LKNESVFICVHLWLKNNSAFASRHRQFIKDFLADRFAGFPPGPDFAGNGHSVAQKFWP